MAADGDRFEKTLVSGNCLPQPNLVVAIGFYGAELTISSAIGDGWKATGTEFQITASRLNKLYDLDQLPALSLYEKHLGSDAKDLPMSGLRFPLRISDPVNSATQLVRTLLAIDRDVGMLTFAGNMPEGWMAELMHASSTELIEAAQNAAAGRQTHAAATAQATILVSCIGRRLVLGERSYDEVKTLRTALGGSPAISGFYSYGEFATPAAASRPKLFNQTLTAFSLSEAVK